MDFFLISSDNNCNKDCHFKVKCNGLSIMKYQYRKVGPDHEL